MKNSSSRRGFLKGAATVERCLHVGIGIERWMKEGLVDVLTIGGAPLGDGRLRLLW